MKKLLLALGALVASLASPALNAAARQSSRAAATSLRATLAAMPASKGVGLLDAAAPVSADTAAVLAQLEDKPDAPVAAPAPSGVAPLVGEELSKTSRVLGDIRALLSGALTAAVTYGGGAWLDARAREVAEGWTAKGISYVSGENLKFEAVGVQTLGSAENCLLDVINLFADQQADLSFTISDSKMGAAFDKTAVATVKPIVTDFIGDMSKVYMAHGTASAGFRSSAPGSDARTAATIAVGRALLAKVSGYEAFIQKLAPYQSSLNSTQKFVFVAAEAAVAHFRATLNTYIATKAAPEKMSAAVMKTAEGMGFTSPLIGTVAGHATKLTADLAAAFATDTANYAVRAARTAADHVLTGGDGFGSLAAAGGAGASKTATGPAMSEGDRRALLRRINVEAVRDGNLYFFDSKGPGSTPLCNPGTTTVTDTAKKAIAHFMQHFGRGTNFTDGRLTWADVGYVVYALAK